MNPTARKKEKKNKEGMRTYLKPRKSTHQLLENALVQPPLLDAAVVECMVPVLEAVPVLAELLEAVGVYVGDDARGAARHFSAFLHALELASPKSLRLALHVVVVVGAAAGADEVSR